LPTPPTRLRRYRERIQGAELIRRRPFPPSASASGSSSPRLPCRSGPDRKLLFQGSKQSPYITWRTCAVPGPSLSKMRIVNPFVGGGFSGKHDPLTWISRRQTGPGHGSPGQDGLELRRGSRGVPAAQCHGCRLENRGEEKRAITGLKAECVLEGGPISGSVRSTSTGSGPSSTSPTKYLRSSITGNWSIQQGSCGTVRGRRSSWPVRPGLAAAYDCGRSRIDHVDIRSVNASRTTGRAPTVCGGCVGSFGVHPTERRQNRLEGEPHEETFGRGLASAALPIPPGRGWGPFRVFGHVETPRGRQGDRHPWSTEIGQGPTPSSARWRGVLGLPFEDMIQGSVTPTQRSLIRDVWRSVHLLDGNATILAAKDLKRQLAEIAAKE